MSQLILSSDHSLNRGANSQAQDLKVGGQSGLLPDFAHWANAGKLVKPRLIAVLLRAPGGMKLQANGTDRIAFLKAMVELHAKSITGLNRSMTAEFVETVVSNAGEMMENVSKTSRERSVPSFVWDELDGKPITRMIEDWMIDLMMDPETGHPRVITYDEYTKAENPVLSPDFKSMTVLFIEPTATLDGVLSAYLITNMMPKGFTEEASRVIGEALEAMEQTVEFTGITQTGEVPRQMALDYLDSLNKNGLSPQSLTGFLSDIDADVSDDAVELGNRVAVNAVADAL